MKEFPLALKTRSTAAYFQHGGMVIPTHHMMARNGKREYILLLDQDNKILAVYRFFTGLKPDPRLRSMRPDRLKRVDPWPAVLDRIAAERT